MALHGSNAELWLDGVNASTYFNSLEFAVEVDTAETTTFRNSWKNHIEGPYMATVETGGFYDPDYTALKDTLSVADSVLTVLPAGSDDAGANARLVQVLATAYKESSPVGGAVAFNWSVEAKGTVGLGKVLYGPAAVTADGSGSNLDGGAATTTGAVAHLHVFSVSSADSVIVTIEDSANGSSGWATIGTFASKSAAGAERITIAGTVRRYVRATFDVTGTSVSINLAVAFARL